MSEPKRYRIRTVADFLALPPDKVTACLLDFACWLEIHHQTKELFGESVRVVTPSDMFEWIDDGKHIMALTLRDPEGNVIDTEEAEFAPPETADVESGCSCGMGFQAHSCT